MSYTSIYNQAERLRHALRNIQSARKYLEGHFGQPVEDCLELVYEDCDNAERKITAALIPLDELLNEMDPDEEENEGRYTLEHVENRIHGILSSPEKIKDMVNTNPFLRHVTKGGMS